MAIYRGPGGSGDATQDAASEVLLALQAKDAAIAAQAAAEAAQVAAQLAETNAETAETNAETAETNAETAETNAETAETNAAASASAASTSATNAAASASTATTQATNAASSASSASTSASNASTSASAASTSATNAANSATSASGSASTATTQATNASNSATAAATSATNAANSATAASTSETNAASSATSASGSASTATTQATNAASSATSASGSASTATTQAGIATTQATNAASSASSASTSATNAASSASTATTQATNASNSASSASTSATNAANSATAAAASAASINPASIVITGGSINGTTIGATTASTGKFSTLEATGVTTVQAGTVSAPALTTTGDTNTGIFFPAADTIAFTEGGVESMRVDSSGNVGIGTSSPLGKLEVRGSGNTALYLHTGNNLGDNSLIYFGDTGSATVGLLAYDHGTNAMTFHTNSAERMRITSAGNVGIGLTAPTRLLHIDGGSSATYFQMTNTASGRTNADGFQIAQDGANAELINREAGYLNFATSNTERMRITSTGVVSIGNSAPAGWTSPFNALTMNTQGSLMATDGSMQMGNNIYYDGSYKFIGTGYANRYYQNGGDHTWTASSASGSAGGAVTENTLLTLNSSACLILKGGTGTSSVGIAFPATQVASSNANTLDDYEEGTWTPTYFGSTTAGTTTYTGQKGTYVKIGNSVYCECDMSWSAKTGTGDGLIGGLPVAVGGYATDSRALFYIGAYSGYSITGTLAGIVNQSSSNLILYAINNGSLAGSAIQNSGEVRFQFWYRSAD